jgi:diphthamide biosynthesis protein 7
MWDVRNMTAPLKDLPLGGGIWRIKWHPDIPGLLATACMHNHFAVVDAHVGSGGPMERVGEYRGHTSLAYGVDWCKMRGETKDNKITSTLASCSFYDHSMQLWNTSYSERN